MSSDPTSLSRSEIEEAEEAFKMFDKDGDGAITPDELGVVMRSFGLFPTDAEIMEMVEEVDSDGNGVIDFSEFLTMVKKQKFAQENEPDIGLDAFKVFDINGDGFISREELAQIMARFGDALTEEEVEMMIEEADADGDGQISYKEFSKLLLCG